MTPNFTETVKNNKQEKIKVVEPATMASLSVDEILNQEFPMQPWLVRSLIPAGAITIISAPPNSYKTLSMTHLAICVATGKPFYGQFTTSQSGVLIVDEENGLRLVQQQLKMLGATPDLPIRVRSRHNFMLTKENINLIVLDCKTYNLSTVIFDSLIDMHTANENDSIEMGRVFGHFKQLTAEGITVIILHHDRKPGQTYQGGNNEMRGSSNIYAQADSHISLNRKGDQLIVKPTKLRYAPHSKPFEVLVKYDETTFEFEYVGGHKGKHEEKIENLREAIVSLLNEYSQLLKKDILEKLREKNYKVNEHNLKELLGALVEDEVLDTMPGLGNGSYYFLMPEKGGAEPTM